MNQRVSAQRVATLVAGFDREPAWSGLADGLREVIGDGRLGLDVRLPSERELTGVLQLSRTTISRAYEALRESGYARSRTGAGTWTAIPGGRRQVHDHLLRPSPDGSVEVDLMCAAASAPPGLMKAYEAATRDLPAMLASSGYHPQGLGPLRELVAQRFTDRGLRTDPDQIVITTGALAGVATVARALTTGRDRVAMESPTYPNATAALAGSGARLVALPVDDSGWDIEATVAGIHQARPRLTYLIPDFHNPTGHLMDSSARQRLASALARRGSTLLVDESAQALAFEDELATAMPEPMACHDPGAITVGGPSKSHWGGMRLGWLRAPAKLVEPLVQARTATDLGSPIFEQLVLTHLLADGDSMVVDNRRRFQAQLDALVAALGELLPEWQFFVPRGGLVLWVRLPRPVATTLAMMAEARGVMFAPGPVFAVEGGLNRHLRIPFVRPEAELRHAVEVMAELWPLAAAAGERRGGRDRLLVT